MLHRFRHIPISFNNCLRHFWVSSGSLQLLTCMCPSSDLILPSYDLCALLMTCMCSSSSCICIPSDLYVQKSTCTVMNKSPCTRTLNENLLNIPYCFLFLIFSNCTKTFVFGWTKHIFNLCKPLPEQLNLRVFKKEVIAINCCLHSNFLPVKKWRMLTTCISFNLLFPTPKSAICYHNILGNEKH